MELATGGRIPSRDPADVLPIGEPDSGSYIPLSSERRAQSLQILRDMRDRLDLDEE